MDENQERQAEELLALVASFSDGLITTSEYNEGGRLYREVVVEVLQEWEATNELVVQVLDFGIKVPPRAVAPPPRPPQEAEQTPTVKLPVPQPPRSHTQQEFRRASWRPPPRGGAAAFAPSRAHVVLKDINTDILIREKGTSRRKGRGGKAGGAVVQLNAHSPSDRQVALPKDRHDLLGIAPAPPIPSVRATDPQPDLPLATSYRLEPISRTYNTRHLPSLKMRCRLPPEYPSQAGPDIDLLDKGWLNPHQAETVAQGLQSQWSGDETLYFMADSLRLGELFSQLRLSSPLKLYADRPMDATPTRLFDQLAAYDRSCRTSAFQQDSFDCGICLEAKKGRRCFKLERCGDVFCLECLADYFQLCIREGMARQVHCPSIGCVRERNRRDAVVVEGEPQPGDVSTEEIRVLVGDELLARYDWLVEKQRIEADPLIRFCPRDDVPVTGGEDDHLRVCTKCSYAFCALCQMSWHGINPCKIKQSSAIVEAFLEADEEGRTLLERRYGAKNVHRLVAIYEEEKANSEWLEENSTPCPGCKAHVEKSAGCSHMQCLKCQKHFCYRCGESLKPSDPYAHYSDRHSSCFNRLFDFQPGEEPQPEEWIADIIGNDFA